MNWRIFETKRKFVCKKTAQQGCNEETQNFGENTETWRKVAIR